MLRRLKLLTKIFFLLLFFYAIAGFFILPKVLLPKINETLKKSTDLSVDVEAMTLNPFSFAVRLSGITVFDKENDKLMHLASVEVNVDPLDLLEETFKVEKFLLEKPVFYITYRKDGSFNFSYLLQSNTQEHNKSKESALPHIVIKEFMLQNGSVVYRDLFKEKPFDFQLENIVLDLQNIDTKNLKKGSFLVQMQLAKSGYLEIDTKIQRVEPLQVSGDITLEFHDLQEEFAYVKESLGLHLTSGKAALFSRFDFDANKTEKTTLSHCNFSLYDIKVVANENDRALMNLDYFYANDMVIKPFEKSLYIPHTGLRELNISATMFKDASLDWQHYLQGEPQQQREENTIQKAEHRKAWKLLVEDVVLRRINFDFKDKRFAPALQTSVSDLYLHAKDITLDGSKKMYTQMNFKLNKGAECNTTTAFKQQNFLLEEKLRCKDIDVAYYAPYMEKEAKKVLYSYHVDLRRAFVDFDIRAELHKDDGNYSMLVHNSMFKIKKLLVTKKGYRHNILNLQELLLEGISADTKEEKAEMQRLKLSHLHLALQRYKNGSFNFENIVTPKKSSKKSKKEPKRQFDFLLKTFEVQNSQLDFTDYKLTKRVKKKIHSINFQAHNVDLNPEKWLDYKGSLRLGKKTKLSLEGKLLRKPLEQKGKVTMQNFVLAELNPYLQEQSYLFVKDGSLSVDMRESYKKRRGADFRSMASLNLKNLNIQNRNDANATLVGVKKLTLKPITLELFPNRLFIDKALLDAFFVSVKIDENKSLNFAKLMKRSTEKEKIKEGAHAEKQQRPTDIKIAKLVIKNSNAFFSDYSLPIRFATDIHSLNGEILGIANRSGETTFVSIDGGVDAYGSTQIKGSLDAFNPKKFTDITMNFKNLDLKAMSGYSASFAGYKIKKGKLFLDLEYKIEDAKLYANNSVVIKNIVLGEEIDTKGVSHLPLGFVIGLLEDSNGVIDISLPITGDVNNPDFKYGKIVWNTLTNLITKAVSSPFRFLGSMLGIDAKELESLEFAYGRATIAPPQREKLDKLVMIMKKRPKIALDLTPVYDMEGDKKALQLQKLIAAVVQLSGDENKEHRKTALTIEMLEQIYKAQKDAATYKPLATIKERLQQEYKEEDALKHAYQKELIMLCSSMQTVTQKELEALAVQRVENIEKYMVKKGIVLSRLLIKSVKSVQNEAKEGVLIALNIEVKSLDK